VKYKITVVTAASGKATVWRSSSNPIVGDQSLAFVGAHYSTETPDHKVTLLLGAYDHVAIEEELSA